MDFLRIILLKLQKYYRFRVFYANLYPILKKYKILKFIKKFQREDSGDPWSHHKETSKFDLLFREYRYDVSKLIIHKKSYNIGFIINPNPEDINNIKNACKDLDINYVIYNIKDPLLFKEIRQSNCSGIFIWPSAYQTYIERTLFHECTQILSTETKIMIYPSPLELNIYEAKRTLTNFLILNNIPHPTTTVFYDFKSAKLFLEQASFPIIFKTHIGASASGVEILKNKKQALKLANILLNKQYLRKFEIEKRASEWGYLLLQEYVSNAKEYRIIKIGDSWFGYQKWKNDNQVFMSGSGILKWIDPPEKLLNFCYDIAYNHKFTTMCFDIFENSKGDLLVNELQTWFGSYNPSQMYINNVPGRYLKQYNSWIFEPGLFNIHGSILLRIVDMISRLQQDN
jgi:hypothetical protein